MASETLSQEELNKRKATMSEVNIKNVSDKEIEEDIARQNIAIGSTLFEVAVRELDEKDSSTSDSGEGSNTSTASMTQIEFGDGKVGILNIMLTPIENTLEIAAKDNEKDKAEKEAEKEEQDKGDRE